MFKGAFWVVLYNRGGIIFVEYEHGMEGIFLVDR